MVQGLRKTFFSTYQGDTHLLFLVLAAIVLLLNNAWVPGLFLDGGIYSVLGQNAAEKGFWVIPHFTQDLGNQFFEHPPFYYMLEGLFFKLFGSNWAQARIFQFLFTLSTLLVVYRYTSQWYGKRFAFICACILLFCIPFLKKGRFPNLDIPLTLFTTWAILLYLNHFPNLKNRDWMKVGLLFGLALIHKGHPALMIPFIILLHLIFTRHIILLARPFSWAGLFLGFALFGLWPLILYLKTGQINGFNLWFEKQFLGTVLKGRGRSTNDYLLYFKILFKYSAPWFLLALYSLFIHFKQRSFGRRFHGVAVWFLTILICYSSLKWKYGHYILPLYPAMAIMATLALVHLIKTQYLKNAIIGLKTIIVLAGLILMVFPLTNEVRRDRFLFKALDLAETLPQTPKIWADVNEAYGLWSFAPPVLFGPKGRERTARSFDMNEVNQLIQQGKLGRGNYAFYLNLSDFQKLKQMAPQQFSQLFHALAYSKRKNKVVIVDKKYQDSEFKTVVP